MTMPLSEPIALTAPEELHGVQLQQKEAPYDFKFTGSNGQVWIEIKKNGDFYVKGKLVENDRELYEAMCSWLHECSMFHVEQEDDCYKNG